MDLPIPQIILKRDSVTYLSVLNIQKLILHILKNKKRPVYLSITNKKKIKYFNLIFLNQKPNNLCIKHDSPYDIKFTYQKNFLLHGEILGTFDFLIQSLRYQSRIKIVRDINSKHRKRNGIKLNPDCNISVDLNPVIERGRDKLMEYLNLELLTPESIRPFIAINWQSVYDAMHYYNINIDYDNFQEFTNHTTYFLVSLDCEMVMTTEKHEVGRVTLLDNTGTVLYDRIVQPDNEITDYLTDYSGLTPESFIDSVSFSEMKQMLEMFIGKDTVIVGHGLWNDLLALKIKHSKLIDTTFLYQKTDGTHDKLETLSILLLSRSIQSDGHCSIKDANACLELLCLRVGEFKDYRDKKNEISDFPQINFGEGKDGINVMKMDKLPRDGVIEGFSMFFYEEDGVLYFFI